MKEYEFHVGDIVIALDGEVGYIDTLCATGSYTAFYWYALKGDNKIINRAAKSFDYEKYFGRIGRYTFTQKDNNEKIAPLTYHENKYSETGRDGIIRDFIDYVQMPEKIEIVLKINEIIDCINNKGE